MEPTETIQHTPHPIKNDYFINELELSHTVGKDFWLGRNGSDQRVWLSNELERAVVLAEEKIG